jgi:hypothetical protein
MNQSISAAGNIDCVSAALDEDARTLFAAAAAAEAQRRGAGVRCHGDSAHLAPNTLLLPGIGCASVSKNGETVIELQGTAGEHAMTAGDVERLALAEPAQEWRIHMVSLLDDRHYRREGAGLWRLYARGYGLS